MIFSKISLFLTPNLLIFFVRASKMSIETSRLNSLAAASVSKPLIAVSVSTVWPAASVSKSLVAVSVSSVWASAVKFALKRLHGLNTSKTTL